MDVLYWERVVTSDGKGRAHLYLDGRHHARSALAAVFPVPGGWIELVPSSFGLRRCHLVAADGSERALTPDAGPAEGRRGRLEREHPALSRLIAFLSVLLLVVPIGLVVPQIVEALSRVPLIADRFGTVEAPFALSWWHNALLALCASTASVERSTRLRFSALLDGAS